MRWCCHLVGFVMLTILLSSSVARAEPPRPFVGYLYPPGGQRGTDVQATVTGQNLLDAGAIRISGEGVCAKVVKVVNTTTAVLAISIDKSAPLGVRDVRIITPGGASNRTRFVVGELPEILAASPINEKSLAQRLQSLPILINGQLFEGDRNFFRFKASKGQTIVCQAQARVLLPLIGDAVPGWNDPVLTLYDAGGREMQTVDDFRFNPDPVLMQKIPADGEYLVEIHDSLFRGRGDFRYRLSIGELPFITDLFPLGGQCGTTIHLALRGVNLPMEQIELRLDDDGPRLRCISIRGTFVDSAASVGRAERTSTDATSAAQTPVLRLAEEPDRTSKNPALRRTSEPASSISTRDISSAIQSNELPFAVSELPELTPAGANHSPSSALRIETPVIINGRIEKPGQADYFTFSARNGQKLVMDVHARRLESPLDAILTLYDAQMHKLAEVDDTIDLESPIGLHQADPRMSYLFASDGDYILRVRDVQDKGGVEYGYRLTIEPPHPDFAVRVTDNQRASGQDSAMLTATVIRKDGFAGPIEVAVKDLPPGFVVSQALISPGAEKTFFTISAPANAAKQVLSLNVVGRAVIDGAVVERRAIGIETLTQAFSYVQTLTTQEAVLAVTDGGAFTLSAEESATKMHELAPGGELKIRVKANRFSLDKSSIGIKGVTLPYYISVKYVLLPVEQEEGIVTIALTKNAPLDLTQNIVLIGIMRTSKETVTRTLPAIPIHIAAKAPAPESSTPDLNVQK